MTQKSQPAWAAWIEIESFLRLPDRFSLSQPAWAAWIEMVKRLHIVSLLSRSPHGLRGLKFNAEIFTTGKSTSQPAWAAWIEIE